MRTEFVHAGAESWPFWRDLTSRWHGLRRRYKWWQLALFVIGVIAFVSVMSALFFAVGHKPSEVYTDSQVPAVNSAEFSTALATIVGAPVEHGGTITILNNGDEFLPELLKSIDAATRTINFSVYIWSSGAFSDEVLRALETEAAAGRRRAGSAGWAGLVESSG